MSKRSLMLQLLVISVCAPPKSAVSFRIDGQKQERVCKENPIIPVLNLTSVTGQNSFLDMSGFNSSLRSIQRVESMISGDTYVSVGVVSDDETRSKTSGNSSSNSSSSILTGEKGPSSGSVTPRRQIQQALYALGSDSSGATDSPQARNLNASMTSVLSNHSFTRSPSCSDIHVLTPASQASSSVFKAALSDSIECVALMSDVENTSKIAGYLDAIKSASDNELIQLMNGLKPSMNMVGLSTLLGAIYGTRPRAENPNILINLPQVIKDMNLMLYRVSPDGSIIRNSSKSTRSF